MITNPSLQKYRHGDFVQYINNVLELVTNPSATTFSIATQRTVLHNSIQRENIFSKIKPIGRHIDKPSFL